MLWGLRVPDLLILLGLFYLEGDVVLVRFLSQVLEDLFTDLLVGLRSARSAPLGLPRIFRRPEAAQGRRRFRALQVKLVLQHHFVVDLLGHNTAIVLAPEMLLGGRMQFQVDRHRLPAFLGVVENITEFFVNAAPIKYNIIDAHLEHAPLHRLGTLIGRFLDGVRRSHAASQ